MILILLFVYPSLSPLDSFDISPIDVTNTISIVESTTDDPCALEYDFVGGACCCMCATQLLKILGFDVGNVLGT
jgi:hypothetical protein